ncbi:MAG TPA: dUTP diphosphatase [Acholeplasmataceae bacterium]|nr:dUTP diphosphatase [Acholeplasmataceae bacterium]
MIRYSKVRDVKDIERGTPKSAGLDFFVPNDVMTITLEGGERALIPSGIRAQIPEGHALIFFNKSGVGSKFGLDILACVVDEDYQGEIHLNVVNTGNDTVYIGPGMKLVQGVLIPVLYSKPMLVSDGELFTSETERGAGGFGSTNKEG